MERVKRAAKQTDAHGSSAVPFYSGEFALILAIKGHPSEFRGLWLSEEGRSVFSRKFSSKAEVYRRV
jgi:hypothetical protein